MPDAFPDRGEIRFLKVRDAGSVLNATFALLRRNAREVLLGFLAIVGPVALASGLSTALYLRRVGHLFADPAALEADPLGMFNLTYVGILVFGVLTGTVSQAAAGAYVRLYRLGEAGTVTVGRLWDEAKGLILPMVGLTFVFGAVSMFSAVIAIVPCLGAIAWVAFLVWLIPYYAVTMASRVVEVDSLAEAWQRARVLVKGSWGFAFGAFLLAGIIFYIITIAASLPVSVIMFGGMVSTTGEDPSGMLSVMGALAAPLQALASAGYLIPLVAAYFIHGRLVEELEGTTLYDDLDALADRSPASRWTDEPAPSTPPSPPFEAEPPRLGGPPSPEPPAPAAPETDGDDAPPSGFRGGGFGPGG